MAIKIKDGGSAVIMTEAQIEELPTVCRVIVRQARYIEEMCCNSLVSFNEFKKQRNIMRSYVSAAAQLYMPLSVKDGPQTTV